MSYYSSLRLLMIIPILLVGVLLFSQQNSKLYYFAVASSHYTKIGNDGLIHFSDLPDSKYSAEIFKKASLKLGAKKGGMIFSSENNLITEKRIFSSLQSLIKKIDKDGAKNKLLLIYFCGHGVAEKETKSIFFLPGDFKFDYSKKYEDALQKHALNPLKIAQRLNKINPDIKYLLFFDCCYDLEGENSNINRIDSSEAYIKSLRQPIVTKNAFLKATEIARAENLQRKIPTIFAAPPGNTIKFVSSPNSSDSIFKTGPLARRFYLIVEDWGEESIKFTYFIKHFMDPTCDPITNSLFTYFEWGGDCPWQKVLDFEIK